jgi:type II secretory pathway component PulM
MIVVFKSRNIQREAFGALLMLKAALQRNQATAALIQAVAAELRQLEGSSGSDTKSQAPSLPPLR